MAPQRNNGAGAEAELPEYAGHYRLESCLGSGGMGVVHLARSTSGMRVAVKVVHAQYARDPEFRGRFRQEVAAARRVSGAFTASVVDADPEAERPWMATLFIPGPTLADQVKRNGAMPSGELRRLMAGLAEALRDIHRVGVVHRDLKPSNVLLAEDGPKVIDFGISRPKDSELRTETGKLIGTPPFMAPEQFRRPREVGPAADIFALGSVMVHAATGRGPFDSDSPYVVAYQVVHDEPDLTGVPENLAPLVLRCLAKEPDDRPTPDELMRELRSVAASYDTQAFIPAQRTIGDSKPEGVVRSPDPRPEGPKGRLRKGVILAAGALLLATGGAFASVQLLDGSGGAPQESSTRSASAGFDAWEIKPGSGNRGMPQCSYGVGKLLCSQAGLISALDPAKGKVLWRHALSDPSAPDGPPVAEGGLVHVVMSKEQRLVALDPASGATRWTLDISAYGRVQYAGGMVLLTGSDGTVTGVDGASGKQVWSHRIAGQSAPNFASFGADGLAYATSTTADGARTRASAVDPQTGEVRWDAHLKGVLRPVGTHDGKVFFMSVDNYSQADALVRYAPESHATQSVALDTPLLAAGATVHGDTVYLLAGGGGLVAVDMEARAQRWRLETSVSQGSAPVADDRYVYFTAADGRLLAVDARKGKLAGQTRARLGEDSDRVVLALPAPVIIEDSVHAAAPDGTVFAVDGRNPSTW
ncbi:serine/threonine-protein kinase [Streptomyces sp. NBC_00243]|uniref:serine/threonine-protein kinase n=1 Tax=Streptomyces sp. NBC_00243 TaxID=2975688 RepID=UPI002DD908E3|nr:serine/threonine-protein kinase [Streptomyces sp. NBC_00243]WRZ20740.1 serine/threonine-protein kinase [Streptomyces sp. NBC_00243]